MSIFDNKEYLSFIKKTQYSEMLFEELSKNEEKYQKFENRLKNNLLNKLYDEPDIKIEDLNVKFEIKNFNNFDEKQVNDFTGSQYSYMFYVLKRKEILELNITNDIEELNDFIFITISCKKTNKKLRLKSIVNDSINFNLIETEDLYNFNCVTHISNMINLF